jgi:RHS repeat-associated protein
MSTRTHTTSRTPGEAEIPGLPGVERSEPAGRAQRGAGEGAFAEGLGPARRRELSGELIEDALDRARSGLPIGELPEELRERLTDAMIDELISGRQGEAEILGPEGLLGHFTRRLVERAMGAELTEHLGYEPGQAPPGGAGNVSERYSYDAFGNPTISGAIENPFLYTRQMWEPEAGLYYDRARFYEPQSGRFISRDPVAAINPYPYVKGDPTNARDPSGAFGLVEEESAMSVEGVLLGVGVGSMAALVIPNVGAITHFLSEHRHEVVDALVATACIAAPAVGCLGATVAGFGISSAINGFEAPTIGSFFAHEGVTLAETLIFGGAGLTYGGLAATGLIEELGPSLARVGLNAAVTWPNVAGVFLNEPIAEAIFRAESEPRARA